ncbi:NADH:flavorubredoxin reductase NorW [Psychromonas sp. SP041]|uniref:NADH:flavorubredoxin reductase NorW n=1 Tax=Psychromonas sp. SP041 TaxID=1365007 RepID=UPI00041EE71A|nr:NADH:flavorubredoxin reductase NorW [Psychromonas sp. SP041]
MTLPIVIIGSGFAAYQLVKALRRQNNEIDICIITADSGDDYNKPDLSHVFSKKQSVADVINTTAAEFAEQYKVRLITKTRVNEIDGFNKFIIAGEHKISYSKLVLATGATPFIPAIKGNAAQRLLTLNSLQEFAACQEQITSAESVLVIGGGLIGVEIALDLANAGKQVTLVEPSPQLMSRQLPEYVALELQKNLVQHNIEIKTACTVSAIELEAALDINDTTTKHGQMLALLSNNDHLQVDQVIVCAGLKPNTQLADQSNIKTEHGICVDAHLQTSIKDIYSLGDCAQFEGLVRAYLQPILISANALAKTLLDAPSAVNLPNIMIKVKTPTYPIQIGGVTCSNEINRWIFDVQTEGIIAKAYNEQQKLIGFVVTAEKTAQAFPLLRELSQA